MDQENDLVQCVYASAAVHSFDKAELHDLLAIARDNNSRRDVTGMLLYQNRSFFQVLEGPGSEVDSLFEHISRDTRHTKVIKILRVPIEERSFAQWTMGYSDIAYADLATIDGLNDFFTANRQFCDIEPGKAETLLESFKDGGWRQTIR